MDGRIGRLNCRCQVLGAPESAGALQARLERVIRDRLAGDYDAALQEALGDDPAVYVLRHVRARLTLVLAPETTDKYVAQRSSARMAGATVGCIAREVEGHNLVRFADQAEYVARFVMDLLAGRAWNRWFYGAFGALRYLDLREALHTVLDENRAYLPAILRYLYRYGGLAALLAALGMKESAWLWSLARGGEPLDHADAESLLSITLKLFDRLDLWRGTRPEPSLLLDAFVATQQLPIDWRDQEGLTNAVLEIALFLLRSSDVNLPERVDEMFQSRLHDALSGWNWLRADRLESGLLALLRPSRQTPRSSPHDRADAELLLATIVELFERLELWRGTHSERSALLDALMTARPLQIDWLDEAGLTSTVLDVALFLVQNGFVGRPDHADRVFQNRLHGALSSVDWLTTDRLESGLLDLLCPSPETRLTLPRRPVTSPLAADRLESGRLDLPHPEPETQLSLPLRPISRALTPRQRRLLDDLRAILAEGGVELDGTEPDSSENALRLYSALIAHEESWAGDAQATETIQRLLEGWKWIRQGGPREEILRRLGQGDSRGALKSLAYREQRAETSFEFIAALGAPGSAVLQALERVPDRTGLGTDATETRCAGVALLMRALLDIRFPSLVKASGLAQQPGLNAILLAMFLAWAGEAGRDGTHIDPGLQFLAGVNPHSSEPDAIHTLDQLRIRWHDANKPGDWHAAWLRALASQRLLQPDVLQLYRLEHGNDTLLVGGDESGKLWPLGHVIQAGEDEARIVSDWLEAWRQVTGRQPVLIAGPEMYVSSETRGLQVTHSDAEKEIGAAYLAGRERLLATLDALEAATLGHVAWDLTMALSANALLRLWARWLRGFADSSVPYLLSQLIRREGRIYEDRGNIVVEMEPRPLDLVLDLSGYLASLRLSWLGDRDILFQIRGA